MTLITELRGFIHGRKSLSIMKASELSSRVAPGIMDSGKKFSLTPFTKDEFTKKDSLLTLERELLESLFEGRVG